MGDKGGKKDKDKGQKQKAVKQAGDAKAKADKQAKPEVPTLAPTPSPKKK